MLTPGVKVSRSSNLRPRIGVWFTVIWFSVTLLSVLTVSTVGVTSIVTVAPTLETVKTTGRFKA